MIIKNTDVLFWMCILVSISGILLKPYNLVINWGFLALAFGIMFAEGNGYYNIIHIIGNS